MHKQLQAWELVLFSLQQQVPVMLMYVIESKGSSPGRQGFVMAVNAHGTMSGSLGGGIMEHKFVELAKSRLHEHKTTVSIHRQLHDKTAANNQSGMICSGEQTIFVYQVSIADLDAVLRLVQSLHNNENGTLELSASGIRFKDWLPLVDGELLRYAPDDFMYTERTGYKNHLYIIGAGHCSLALSKLMSELDFFIHLVDDRPDLVTMNENDFAHRKLVLHYNELSQHITPGENIYVAVMTAGYRTDKIVIKTLLRPGYQYFGVLGSKYKINKLTAELLVEGMDPHLLQQVRAPMGVEIKSQSPAEIAVSIAAEIIRIKNQEL